VLRVFTRIYRHSSVYARRVLSTGESSGCALALSRFTAQRRREELATALAARIASGVSLAARAARNSNDARAIGAHHSQ